MPDAIAPVVGTASLEATTYNNNESNVLAEPQTIVNHEEEIAQQPEPEAEVKTDACLQADTGDTLLKETPKPHSVRNAAHAKEKEKLRLQREYKIWMNQFSADDLIEVSENAASFKSCIGLRGRVAAVSMKNKQISVNLENGLTNIRFWANELILVAKAETFST